MELAALLHEQFVFSDPGGAKWFRNVGTFYVYAAYSAANIRSTLLNCLDILIFMCEMSAY